jgi:hypothetical protein
VTVTNSNVAPALAQPADITYHAGTASPSTGTLSASDPNGDPLTYKIEGVFRYTPAAQAYQVASPLGLIEPGGNYYFNTRKAGEKYLQGTGNQWYFILPSGQFYQFTGTTAQGVPQGNLLATLDSTYWSDPALLAHAPRPASWTANAQAAYDGTHVPGNLGLVNTAVNYYFNARGYDEKYLQGSGATAGQWYFILPNGQLYQFSGSVPASILLATLDVTYWSDPTLLLAAQANSSAVNPAVAFVALTTTTGPSVSFNIQNITSAYIGQRFLVLASVTDGYGDSKDKKFFGVTIVA